MRPTSTIEIPAYYARLNDYFPAEELKKPEQLEDLVKNQPLYRKVEDTNYLLLYAEFSDFIFVDYLLVDSAIRGKGLGSKVMKRLKSLGKAIVLEVEQTDPANPDTIRRRKFYGRHGFKEATGVAYRREDPHGQPFEMDILVWSPNHRENVDDEEALDMMATVCEEVHNFRARKYYGRIPADPDEVLSLESDLVS